MSITPQVIVTAVNIEQKEPAEQLARDLNLPYVEFAKTTDYPWVLIQGPNHLSLRFPGAAKPYYVDFLEGSYARRLKHASRRREALARAVGLKPGVEMTIMDGTAGWGRDAMLLAKLGAKVIAVERSPIVAALLSDGVRRAQSVYPDISMEVISMDTYDLLMSNVYAPDTIYLDPMFPESPNTALVKKPMQLLQMLLGEVQDMETLLLTALSKAKDRVVIKRPNWSKSLVKTASYSIPAGVVRFDVYLSVY